MCDKNPAAQLKNLPLIHRRQNPDAWHHYAQESGIVIDNPLQGPRYDLHEMAITAALAGLGVALVPKVYIERELREGLLIAPWPETGNVHKIFCLVKPVNSGINQPVLTVFEQWLQAEIAKI
ncbi:MAG: HTH-type transcriptional regulator TrpI [Candidatus Erwinia impunctatus]|nr:HTH-type transcriptional regulator TrpI [Culicoides impunctatus]